MSGRPDLKERVKHMSNSDSQPLRLTWLRGEGSDKSTLLRSSDGKMCCLGFLALQLGAEESYIKGRDCPGQACKVNWPKSLSLYTGAQSPLCVELMKINDGSADEQELTEKFAEANIEVTFIN